MKAEPTNTRVILVIKDWFCFKTYNSNSTKRKHAIAIVEKVKAIPIIIPNINHLDALIRQEIKAHHLVVLVDSCYVGSKFKGFNLLENMTEEDTKIHAKQLKSDLNARARTVLSSGSVGPVSDTFPGTNNSLFAHVFIQVLKEFEKTSVPVNIKNIAWNMRVTFLGTQQKPHHYHPSTWADGGGDFIFIPKKNYK